MNTKLISWNVNGIRSVLNKEVFYEFVDSEKPDILCLQETKASEKNIEIKIDGYHQYWNSAEKKGYSGVVVFSKVKPLNVNYGIGIEEHDKEGRVLTLEFKKYFLVNVYVPNSGRGLPRLNYRKKWNDAFLKYLKKLTKPIVLCGDMNVAHTEIDLANPKSNYNKTAGYTQDEIDGFEKLLKAGFIDTFREFEKEGGHYTYWNYMRNARARNVGWRIDYFLISSQLKKSLKNASILKDVMGSDHCPVGVILNLK